MKLEVGSLIYEFFAILILLVSNNIRYFPFKQLINIIMKMNGSSSYLFVFSWAYLEL